MNWRGLFGLTTAALLGTGILFGASQVPAQQKSLKDRLIGAWTLVSIENTMPDGKRQQPFGLDPKGIVVFDNSGRYSQMQVRAGRPKFQSANRLEPTPQESKAAMNDTLAVFGSWSVDEASKIIRLHIEGSLIPNAEGTEATRINVSVAADELRFSIPGPDLGGRNDSVYRRAK